MLGGAPAHWGKDVSATAANGVVLSPSDPAHQEIARQFHRTVPPGTATITRIFRCHNLLLWKQFELEQAAMESRGDGVGAQPRRLWHGTDAQTADYILHGGFNRSFSRTALYGDGVYFARDASYSASPRYAKPDQVGGLQRCFLCCVLLGHQTVGAQGMVAPPTRAPPHAHLRFDSLVDRLQDPTIVVSGHRDSQCYAEYLVEFRR